MIFYILFELFFFFKQKTAYEMRISDWSSDVCSSDLFATLAMTGLVWIGQRRPPAAFVDLVADLVDHPLAVEEQLLHLAARERARADPAEYRHLPARLVDRAVAIAPLRQRSEEHTYEIPSLVRIPESDFCLKKNI